MVFVYVVRKTKLTCKDAIYGQTKQLSSGNTGRAAYRHRR